MAVLQKSRSVRSPMRGQAWNRYKLRRWIGLLASYCFLTAMVIIIVFPILVAVMSAFNVSNSLYSATLLPERFSLTENFTHLFAETAYLSWYRNTFLLSTISMILSTIIVTISGLIYSRYRFKNRKAALISLLIIQIIPSGAGLIALFAIASSLGIYSSNHSTLMTYLFLVLIYTTGGTTMNTIIMKGYYDSIPRDLDESAKIDGATSFQVFKDILLPLVKPMLVVIAIFCFLGPVGDLIMPKFLIASTQSADKTLAVGLEGLIRDVKNSNYNVFSAGALLAALPPVLVFYKFQKYIVRGLTSGGVKG